MSLAIFTLVSSAVRLFLQRHVSLGGEDTGFLANRQAQNCLKQAKIHRRSRAQAPWHHLGGNPSLNRPYTPDFFCVSQKPSEYRKEYSKTRQRSAAMKSAGSWEATGSWLQAAAIASKRLQEGADTHTVSRARRPNASFTVAAKVSGMWPAARMEYHGR